MGAEIIPDPDVGIVGAGGGGKEAENCPAPGMLGDGVDTEGV